MRFPERIDSDDDGFRDYDDQADEAAIDRYESNKDFSYEPWNFMPLCQCEIDANRV